MLNNLGKFKTYGEAANFVLNEKGLESKWLAKEIANPGQNPRSLQSQISRWFNGKGKVSEGYQNRINSALDVHIGKKPDGYWIIYDIENAESDSLDTVFDRILVLRELYNDSKKKLNLSESQKKEHRTLVINKLKEIVSNV